jgi:hypothetical protein
MIFSLPCFLKKIQIGFSYHHVAACFLSLFLSVSLHSFQRLNQSVDFHEIWYEYYDLRGHPNAMLCNNIANPLTHVARGTVVHMLLGPRMAYCNGRSKTS